MDIDNLSNLSHDDLIESTQLTLGTLLRTDPLLSDLPQDIILEEIVSQVKRVKVNYNLNIER